MTILTLNSAYGALSLIKCDSCGATYECLTSKINKSKHHFCNLQCKSDYGTGKPYIDPQYRKDRQVERKDAHGKKKDEVKKRCLRCKRIYYGPPGGFPKSRDPNKPEPGLCGCSTTTFYGEEDFAGGVVGEI